MLGFLKLLRCTGQKAFKFLVYFPKCMDNLSKISGLSREDIVSRLEQNDIRYELSVSEYAGTYFREASVEAKCTSPTGRKILGAPDLNRQGCHHFYAYYTIEPGFDLSQLNGKVTFAMGRLVEVTQVRYKRLVDRTNMRSP